MKHGIQKALLLGLAMILAGCGQRADTKGPGRYRLTYSVFFPPTHTQAKLAVDWAQEIGKRTQGRVQIIVFTGGALTKAEQCYQGVVDGISDLGMSAFAYTRGRFPMMAALDLPLGYPDGASATRIANGIYRDYPPKELENTQIMYLHAHGPGMLATQKPISTCAALKGLKIRATGTCAKIVESLGGSPISMPQGETYEALQKGVVDATFCPIETLKGWKQAEVIRQVTDSSCIGYTTAFFVTMNKETWAKLPPDIRAVIQTVNEEWIARHGQAWNDADAEGLKFLRTLKRDVITLDPEEQERWKQRVEPLLAGTAAKLDQKGLQGSTVIAELKRRVADAKGPAARIQ